MKALNTDILDKAKEDFLNRCFELSGKKHKRYWCVANENDFYVNENKEIIVKEGLPIHYKKWQSEVKETIEVDGKEYNRIVKDRKRVDVYGYAKQDLKGYGRGMTFIFEILDLEYSFMFYNGMYIGDCYSGNTHIQMLCKMYEFKCFDERIKEISMFKSNTLKFDIDINDLGYNYEKSKNLNDVPIYILYDNYGWANECYYVIGLLDFLNLKYDKILEYAKPYVRVFRDLGIDLEKTKPEQRIVLFEKILENKKIEEDKRNREELYYQTQRDKVSKEKKPVCYIIKNKRNGLYKIGYSSNPSLRENTLQSQEPEVEKIKVFKNNHENLLHEKYKKQRVRGEWFNLTNLQVKYICTHFE